MNKMLDDLDLERERLTDRDETRRMSHSDVQSMQRTLKEWNSKQGHATQNRRWFFKYVLRHVVLPGVVVAAMILLLIYTIYYCVITLAGL
jgi:hypothetical protein